MQTEHNNAKVEQRAWRGAIEEITKELENKYKGSSGNLQNIHTPFNLCSEIVLKLKESTCLQDKTFCIFNLEFAEILIYDFSVARENIWFLTDCVEKAAIAKSSRYGVNVMQEDFFEMLKKKEGGKFDVCIINPPYQAPKAKEHDGQGKCGKSLWEEFVAKSFELTKENGYVALIHPARWRKPKSKVGDILRQKNMKYLEIHDISDGLQTFGCETRYDIHITQNCPSKGKTIIRDQDKKDGEYDISKMAFIPNSRIPEVIKLMAKKGEERVELLHSYSDYETRKPWMSREKKGEFKYPCVYMIDKQGVPTLFYSTKRNSHFGKSKLIFSSGRISSANYIVDMDGQYGLTQYAKGIIDLPKNLQGICDAMRSDRFKRIMEISSTSLNEIDKDIVALFRKDFWKDFV